MSVRLPSGLLALVISAALAIPPVTASPAASAACPDVDVVFARGTNEPPGIGKVGDAFVSSLRSQVPKKSVSTYGVQYPANDNFLAALNGARDVSAHVQNMAGTCPATKTVLGGYSQGAAVVDIATAAPLSSFGFRQALPSDVADHVAAVVVFGNPTTRAGDAMTTLSGQYGPKTIDMCQAGDPICTDGGDWSAHTQYAQNGMASKAAAYAAARL